MQLTLPLLGGHSLGPLWHQPVTRAAKPRIRGERRRRLLKRRTPAWADLNAMRRIYAYARLLGHHVDHIVPLQHPLVCGLHCEANLTVMLPLANLMKGNAWWPDAPYVQGELL